MTAKKISLVYTSWCVERGDHPLRLGESVPSLACFLSTEPGLHLKRRFGRTTNWTSNWATTLIRLRWLSCSPRNWDAEREAKDILFTKMTSRSRSDSHILWLWIKGQRQPQSRVGGRRGILLKDRSERANSILPDWSPASNAIFSLSSITGIEKYRIISVPIPGIESWNQKTSRPKSDNDDLLLK